MQIKTAAILTGLALVQIGLTAPFAIEALVAVIEFITHHSGGKRGIEGPAGHVARTSYPAISDTKYDAEPIAVQRRENPAESIHLREEHVVEKRQACGRAPNGVPQNVMDNCCNALRGKTIQVDAISTGRSVPDIRVSRLPYPCISAAPWFDQETTPPFACGDDCLQWTNLNQGQYDRIKQILRPKGGAL